ncbi:MAG: flagellin, partial [Deltaproteobacteria bacterium]|nr:flagellin [Deltaproteobacteria bacterium]
ISSSATIYRGQVLLDSTSDIVFAGDTAAMAAAGLSTTGNNTTTIDQVNVSTRKGATTAITSIDSALSEIDEMRGEMGAVQNRFESTISNLQNVSENIAAARSRIVDADFAAETAALTKSQILQQAGIAMLAQANQLPQAVLSLLQ